MTTAKVAFTNKDYDKAEEYLKKEIEKNPKNEEALIMLADVKDIKGDLKGAAIAINEAEKVVKIPENVSNVALTKNKLWVTAYNKGIQFYNRYFSSKEKNLLDSSIQQFDIAILLRPERADFYSVKGTALELKGDTSEAILFYQNYIKLMEKEIELANNKGVYINIPRKDAVKILGEPNTSTGHKLDRMTDSTVTDKYIIDGKEVFIFSSKSDNDDLKVKGWSVDPPKSWPEFERTQFSTFNISPLIDLTTIYYDKKELDKALKYISIMTFLDPNNVDANAFRIQIYREQGKTDEALNSLNKLVQKYPDNKMFWAAIGDILLTMQKYDDAIDKYEHALKIDPAYIIVFRNLASAYKNKASIIQREQQDKIDKDKNYKPNSDEYLPMLEKSADYFEKCRKSEDFEEDLDVLGDLINIYEVLNKKELLNSTLQELENLEYTTKDKLKFYKIMCNVYTRLKIADKRKTYCDKFQELDKDSNK